MERILACLSPSPSNPKILRAAADMAGEGTELIALFVETPQFPHMSNADRRRLQENIQTAEQLGAKIQTVSGDDVPFQVAEYAKLSGIRKIVLGQSEFKLSVLPSRAGLPDRLAEYLPDAEIHVIPDQQRRLYFPPQRTAISRQRILADLAVMLLMLAVATALGTVLYGFNLSNSSTMMVYLLAVLLIAVITSHRVWSMVASVASLFLFNFYFVQPRYSLVAYEPGYPVSFIVMFLTAIIAGTLANRLKQTAFQASRSAFRSRILSDADQLLAKADSREAILRICAEQSAKLLDRGVSLYEVVGDTAVRRYAIPPDPSPEGETDSIPIPEELARGRAENGCYPIHVQEKLYAILRLREPDPPPELATQSTLMSVLGECALALENEQNAREKKEAAVLAENERLRADLLRSISHDLRTPLTSIAGNAGALLNREKRYSEETRHRLYSDIYQDALWLNDLVENLLASTRLSGGADLRSSAELIEDLFAEAVAHVHSDGDHTVIAEPGTELLLVRADPRLIVQVLVNLIGNALKYTPPGSTIRLSAKRSEDQVTVSVADDGPGISPEEKEHIFDMFFVGKIAVSAGRKSLGLGLALCKAIINAHGGEIRVEDNDPQGAVFSFTLPAEEVTDTG